eukprot:4254583-Pleurochrysis_carterae.AAC.2
MNARIQFGHGQNYTKYKRSHPWRWSSTHRSSDFYIPDIDKLVRSTRSTGSRNAAVRTCRMHLFRPCGKQIFVFAEIDDPPSGSRNLVLASTAVGLTPCQPQPYRGARTAYTALRRSYRPCDLLWPRREMGGE